MRQRAKPLGIIIDGPGQEVRSSRVRSPDELALAPGSIQPLFACQDCTFCRSVHRASVQNFLWRGKAGKPSLRDGIDLRQGGPYPAVRTRVPATNGTKARTTAVKRAKKHAPNLRFHSSLGASLENRPPVLILTSLS